MIARLSSLVVIASLLALPAAAKDKKKPTLPEYVLRASSVLVVVSPGAGEPIDEPMANSTARENVEKALSEWGRFRVVLDGQESDLVIAVRTGSGKMMRPTIKGGPIDQRGGVGQGTDSTVRIGAQQGHPPINDPGGNPQGGPRMGNEIGATDDTFAVYRGGVSEPLNSSALWRYVAKDCLRAPDVSAVDEFRKVIAEAERPQVPKQP